MEYIAFGEWMLDLCIDILTWHQSVLKGFFFSTTLTEPPTSVTGDKWKFIMHVLEFFRFRVAGALLVTGKTISELFVRNRNL